MKTFLAVSVIALTGCTAAQENYYAAHQAAAEAQAKVQAAKFEALAQMASQGGETGAAAVMALALSEDRVLAPQFIEDPALKWAGVLAGPLASLGALYIQADANEDIARLNNEVQIARINNEGQTQRALYGALTAPVEATPPSLGVEELGVVVDGLVTLGLNGTDAIVAVNDRGYTAVTDVSVQGYSTLADISLGGLDAVEGVSVNAVGALTDLSATSVGALLDSQRLGYGTFLDLNDRHLDSLDGSLDGFFTALQNCNCFEIPDGFTLTPVVTPDFSPAAP